MTSEDVPSALALINKWSSQFEIRLVFNCEDEIFHNFLLQDFAVTYVVEDKSNNITDLISYELLDVPENGVHIDTVVSTQSPVDQLLTDALVCARESSFEAVTIAQRNIESDILTLLLFQPYDHYAFHLYNYRYPEISR